jgi:hypothetical protein
MACEILLFAGNVDGDLPLYASHAAYFGGQPAKISANGVDLCLSGADYIGLFKNDSTDDDKSGPQVQDALAPGFLSTGVIQGANKVRVTQAVTGQVFPATGGAGAWAEGQLVYVGSTGLLDNAANASGKPIGRVVKAPASATDDMHIYQFPVATANA